MWSDDLFSLLEQDAGFSLLVEGLRGLRAQSAHGVSGGVKGVFSGRSFSQGAAVYAGDYSQ